MRAVCPWGWSGSASGHWSGDEPPLPSVAPWDVPTLVGSCSFWESIWGQDRSSAALTSHSQVSPLAEVLPALLTAPSVLDPSLPRNCCKQIQGARPRATGTRYINNLVWKKPVGFHLPQAHHGVAGLPCIAGHRTPQHLSVILSPLLPHTGAASLGRSSSQGLSSALKYTWGFLTPEGNMLQSARIARSAKN